MNKFYIKVYSFVTFLIILEIVSILLLNKGVFTYTLDDAYIHLSLAQNIFECNYGINHSEFSSPSSSIVWPFLLAPFSKIKIFYLLPLFFNIIFTFISLHVLFNLLEKIFNIKLSAIPIIWLIFITFILLVCLNIIGIIFLGMEHSLQSLSVFIIALGLINFVRNQNISKLLSISIVLSPLIRYENLAISIPAILFLFLSGKKKISIILFCLIVFLLLSFSYFLYINSGEILPSSVLLKSSQFNESNIFISPIKNFLKSLKINEGLRLAFSLFLLVTYILYSNSNKSSKYLALITSLSIFLHMSFGQYGWFQRYEIYIWIFALIIILYLFNPFIKSVFLIPSLKNVLILLLGSFLFFHHYYYALLATPLASNNIYEQHYFMHRFVKDFYKGNVGVHDIGYVSFDNSFYVLDINGLSSKKVIEYKKNGISSKQWLDHLSKEYDVKMFLIYDSIISVPDTWIKLGVLQLSRKNIIAFDEKVAFYVTSERDLEYVKSIIYKYKKILPSKVKFKIEKSVM